MEQTNEIMHLINEAMQIKYCLLNQHRLTEHQGQEKTEIGKKRHNLGVHPSGDT